MIQHNREAIYRTSDGELVGFVDRRPEPSPVQWVPHALFGSELRSFRSYTSAAEYLRRHGLQILADEWVYQPPGSDTTVMTTLVEAAPDAVKVRLGFDPRSTPIVLSGPDLDRLRPASPER